MNLVEYSSKALENTVEPIPVVPQEGFNTLNITMIMHFKLLEVMSEIHVNILETNTKLYLGLYSLSANFGELEKYLVAVYFYQNPEPEDKLKEILSECVWHINFTLVEALNYNPQVYVNIENHIGNKYSELLLNSMELVKVICQRFEFEFEEILAISILVNEFNQEDDESWDF